MNDNQYKVSATAENAAKLLQLVMTATIVPIPEDECVNGRYYVELPDGYRLIYDNDGYVGHYNPSLAEPI